MKPSHQIKSSSGNRMMSNGFREWLARCLFGVGCSAMFGVVGKGILWAMLLESLGYASNPAPIFFLLRSQSKARLDLVPCRGQSSNLSDATRIRHG